MEQMSDTYYRERAARRKRRVILILVIAVLIGVAGILVRNMFYDNCTQSFRREPETVVQSYLQAIKSGDYDTVQNCWRHHEFYEVETGCSQICLEKILGTRYQETDISVEEIRLTEEGRARRDVAVEVTCPGNGTVHQGQIVLDSVQTAYPWRHWQIIYSTVGGPMGDLWCQE
jgi:hypothetical protein